MLYGFEISVSYTASVFHRINSAHPRSGVLVTILDLLTASQDERYLLFVTLGLDRGTSRFPSRPHGPWCFNVVDGCLEKVNYLRRCCLFSDDVPDKVASLFLEVVRALLEVHLGRDPNKILFANKRLSGPEMVEESRMVIAVHHLQGRVWQLAWYYPILWLRIGRVEKPGGRGLFDFA